MSEITVTVRCECGALMVERLNSVNGSTFMGCSQFPECRKTQPVPAYVEVKRAGGERLPGFEQ